MRFQRILSSPLERTTPTNMKILLCLLLAVVALSSTSAGSDRVRRSGWYPSYSYSAPLVYSRTVYPSYYSGWAGSGWSGNGWNRGWNGGWNGGWKSGWW